MSVREEPHVVNKRRDGVNVIEHGSIDSKQEAAMTVKEQAQALVEELPNDATWDDVMYQLYVRQKIALGIRAGEEGRVQSHEEVKRKFLAS